MPAEEVRQLPENHPSELAQLAANWRGKGSGAPIGGLKPPPKLAQHPAPEPGIGARIGAIGAAMKSVRSPVQVGASRCGP
jgi:hypothetical protein